LARLAVEFAHIIPLWDGEFVRFGVPYGHDMAEEDTEPAAVNGGGHGEYFTVNLPSANKTHHEHLHCAQAQV